MADALRIAAGDGRLTADELDERLEKALTARTYDDLAVLVADLPATGTAFATVPGTPLSAAIAAALAGGETKAKDLVRFECLSAVTERVGRWAVPARMELKVLGGQVKLDFTEAVITQPVLHIDAEVRGGQVLMVRPRRRSLWQWLRRAPRPYAIAA